MSWHTDLTSAPAAFQLWLSERGSLTHWLRRLTDNTIEFRLLNADWQNTTADERLALSLSETEPTWIRECQWVLHDNVLVHGRVVIPQTSFDGDGAALNDIGPRSLGDILFSDPNLKRSEFEIQQMAEGTWARRSLFYFHQQPLLVTETFLPGIVTLNNYL